MLTGTTNVVRIASVPHKSRISTVCCVGISRFQTDSAMWKPGVMELPSSV